jgi:hypothetical protein
VSIATIESRQSVRMLDERAAAQDAAEAAFEMYRDEFLAQCKRDMDALCPLGKPRSSWGLKGRRPPTVAEVIADALELAPSALGVSVDAAVKLLARAARGEDIKQAANKLFLDLANVYASDKLEAA